MTAERSYLYVALVGALRAYPPKMMAFEPVNTTECELISPTLATDPLENVPRRNRIFCTTNTSASAAAGATVPVRA